MPTVIVVGGPAGTGKSTIAHLLSKHFECPFIEGDSLHPQENIDKMSKGIPLTDDDRWDWLKQISEVSSGKCLAEKKGISVVSCSILKKVYRDYIKQNSKGPVEFRFVFLYTTFEELLKRVNNRQGHYMKSDMVKSQYDIMQIPTGNELIKNGGEVLAIDTTSKSPEQIYKDILCELEV